MAQAGHSHSNIPQHNAYSMRPEGKAAAVSILLADDDVHLATFLSKSLESEGYAVHTALDEDSALAELQRQNYKLIILDLNFGQTDGLKLLAKLRAEGVDTPVIVLSARNKVTDRLESFNLGADDYVTKPFSFQELSARAHALLRRKADPSLNILRVEDLELDPATRKVSRAGSEIKLSHKEFHLLLLLMRRAGNVITRQELLHEVWPTQPATDSNLVDVYVNYLRRKIEHFVVVKGEERIREEDRLLHTIRGVGYRIGREAPVVRDSSAGLPVAPEPGSRNRSVPSVASAYSGTPEPATIQQTPWRALVNSVAHDLAQPLTGVRCFLEVTALRKENPAVSPDLKTVEQQADRAIALAKTISSLVREVAVPAGPWTPLGSLFEEVFEDFAVLVHSGLLTIERQWDASIQVTSSPILRQLLVLLVGKLVGKNTRPLTLLVFAGIKSSRCNLELHWRATESGAVQDAPSILGTDLPYIREMVYSLGGEFALQGETAIALKLPAIHNGAPTVQ